MANQRHGYRYYVTTRAWLIRQCKHRIKLIYFLLKTIVPLKIKLHYKPPKRSTNSQTALAVPVKYIVMN
jgi:hypothetical protein